MEIMTVRDLLIIILFSLLIIIIIGGSIAAFIVYRKVNRTIKNITESIQRPIRFVEKIVAYARGGAKGIGEAFEIFAGRDGKKHEETITRETTNRS